MKLQELNNLYKVFSKYKLSDPVTAHYCPVCLSDQDNRYFQTTPLHLIKPVNLSRYFSSVGIFENNQNDFKHFLPRILQIIYEEGNDDSFFFPQVWDRLKEANYLNWEKDEVIAINRFFHEYLNKESETSSKENLDLTREILFDIGYNGS